MLIDGARRDERMCRSVVRLKEIGVCWPEADEAAIKHLADNSRYQDEAARVEPLPMAHTVIELLDGLAAAAGALLVLVLDGVTDPHNLGAYWRAADGTGVTR